MTAPASPTPEAIKAARAAAGLTQTQAAALIYCALRGWQDWEGDGFTDIETDDASLAIFQARETSRGVPSHDLAARVQRLVREGVEWHQRNP